ncbi:hypothetical protein [Paludibaculum fermentans]|uniref:Uncharacterized protein n=1 Tax=Paludibaculum fermentans TaxID=1473598 RepID=A0A7S7NR00_PALFE|nr:hypothetical protein [Paludibaculum fermentans]QOY88153.1 hypothetical protein IRI77_36365 [Paludibaculum fermentans]
MRTLATLSILCFASFGWGQTKPEFASTNAVLNAGGGLYEFAPGSLVYIRGNYLATQSGPATPPYPSTLNGTTVTVTQGSVVLNAALLETLPDRLTVQLPYGLKAGSVTLKVKTAGGEISRGLPILDAAPRPVYRQVNASWIVEAYHPDGSAVTELAPAKPGEEVRLMVQGLGATTPEIAAGALPGDGSLERPFNIANAALAAKLEKTDLEVNGARLAVGRPGFYEVTVVTLADVLAGLYPVTLGIAGSDLVYGASLPAGGRVVQLSKVWNTEACRTTDQAALRLPDDAVLTKIETWYQFPENTASLSFQLLNAAGEEVLASTMGKQACDATSPEWCLAMRANLRQVLPAGEYKLVTSTPGLCVNDATTGQAFVKLTGAWAESNWQVASDGWVTPEGGSFEAPGFKLTAEAGALAEPVNLKISTTTRPREPASDRVTPYFRLEGLPTALAAPVTLTLDVAGTPDGDVTLLMQPEGSDDGPAFFSGQVQDGKLTVALPAQTPEKTTARAARARTGALTSNSKVSWMLWAMAGLKPNTSRDEHFILHAPSSAGELIKTLGNDLEDAYKLIASMGLDWNKRGGSAIEIYLFSYNSWSNLVLGGSSGAAGNSETGIWGKKNTGLCINLDTLQGGGQKELDDARITAGHELLHIMQAQYEGNSSSGWLWMEEASATWLERAMSGDGNYISGNASENMYFLYTEPLEVADWWSPAAARRHGYGASLLLQTLAPASPGVVDARIGDVLKLMESETSTMPVEGLEKVFGPLHEAWWTFCDRYVGGRIIDGYPGYGLLTGGAVKPVAWPLSKSTVSYRERFAYPHLGARLYQVTFDKTNVPLWQDKAKLRFTLTSQGLAKAFVYTMHGSHLEKAGEFMQMFDLEDVQALAEANGRVFVMVSNGSHIYPNNGTTDVQLEMKLDGEFQGVTSLDHSFHGVLYNKYYELDFDVSITGTAPFQVKSAAEAFGCCYIADLITPPIDLKTKEEGKDQVDEFTVTVTYKNLKPGPSAPGGWKAGMRVKAGFDTKGEMAFGVSTMSKTYRVTRGGASAGSTFMTELYWPDSGSLQGGADGPVGVSFTPYK